MSGRVRIGITGAGGGVGQGIIKSLQGTEYELVALDGELLGTGLYSTSISYQIPYAKSPSFIPELLAICKREQIRLLFPGMDAELKSLAENKSHFENAGTTVVVSDPETIEVSNNKLSTYNKLIPAGVSVPVTMDLTDWSAASIPFPLIVKQKLDGARSKNVYHVKDREALDSLLSSPSFDEKGYVAQEYIDGDEFTCGTVNLENKCKGVIVMRRNLRDGDTYKCFSIRRPDIEEHVLRIMNTLKPFGACNVQLRVREGKVYVFEINARCSGTTAARTLCGFNEPKMIADFIVHGIQPSYKIVEQTVLRYWQELVVPNDVVEEMRMNKHLHNALVRKL